MSFIIIAYVVAFFFALNIGASGAAASMGVAYGSGAIRQKWVALVLCGIAVFSGAYAGGGEVVKTIGSGIIPQSFMSVEVVVIILASATLSLFIANLLGIPLSTSEVTVGSIVGIGIAYQTLYVQKLFIIVSFWVIIPVIAFISAFIVGKGIQFFEQRFHILQSGKAKRILTFLVILVGFFEAFSAGMNNVANAVGPLVGAGLLSTSNGIILGGVFVALGALFLGGKVLQTNGKRITSFSLLEGCAISGTGAGLVTIASLCGLPVPITQVTSSAILGIGTVHQGFRIWQKRVIQQMLKVWIVSPVFSLVISYSLYNLLLAHNFYSFMLIVSVFMATLGTVSLMKTIREEQRSIHDQGGGI